MELSASLLGLKLPSQFSGYFSFSPFSNTYDFIVPFNVTLNYSVI